MPQRSLVSILLTTAALAALVASCSKSKDAPSGDAPPGVSSAASRATPSPSPAPRPSSSGPVVLRATVPSAEGGTCSATVDRDCQDCVQSQCGGLGAVDACESLSGNAVTGPAAGKPKAALCREALDCIRRTQCHANSLIDCYCGGQIDLGTCNLTTTDAKGACKGELERALEVPSGSVGSVALNIITEATFAGGTAGIVATCENTGCKNACIPYQATSCR